MSQHSLQDLERELAIVAYCTIKRGGNLAPLLERYEKEIEAARRSDPAERARRILEDYKERGALKAIRSSQP